MRCNRRDVWLTCSWWPSQVGPPTLAVILALVIYPRSPAAKQAKQAGKLLHDMLALWYMFKHISLLYLPMAH